MRFSGDVRWPSKRAMAAVTHPEDGPWVVWATSPNGETEGYGMLSRGSALRVAKLTRELNPYHRVIITRDD